MPKILDNKFPLTTLREAAGFDPPLAAEKISEKLGLDHPLAPETVVAWERRGTRNIDYIQAMSELYRLPLNVISEASKKILN